jgi:hypothetical protein
MRVGGLEKLLETMSTRGWIYYTPASRSKRTILRADNLDQIDWERLRRKRKLEHKQLDQMVRFAGMPDRLKHPVLERYFLTGELPDDDELKKLEDDELARANAGS